MQEKSEEKDGQITTETTRHSHHEEVDDEELPDEQGDPSDTSSVHEITKQTDNNFTTIKDEHEVGILLTIKYSLSSNNWRRIG